MFGSSIIDIAIGIVFVFLLLSLVASTINEMILSFLNMRGKELLRGLKTLLDDQDATGLVSRLYNHGQIFGLFQGDFDPKKTGNLPSYIPAENFVTALLDVARAAAAQPAPAAQPAAAQQDVAAMLASLRVAAQALAQDVDTEKVGKPLVSMIDAAGNDAAKLRKSVEDWYNSAMDRVSGWYKYRTQKILFVLGIVLAIGLNVDTVVVARHLSNDAALRQSLVAAAQETAKKPSTDQQGNPKPIDLDAKAIEDKVNRLQTLGLPIGWLTSQKEAGDPDVRQLPKVGKWPQWLSSGIWQQWPRVVRFHFWGWLITAVAVSLGAPFWFDMLNKIMVARSTVKPREKSGT